MEALAEQPLGRALLADCGPLIETIAMALPPQWLVEASLRNESLKFAAGALMASFPSDVTLVVLCERRSGSSLRIWLDTLKLQCRLEIADVVPDATMSVRHFWIQDTFLVAQAQSGSLYLETASENSGRHGAWLSAYDLTPSQRLDLPLAGGNMLIGDGFRLVGRSSVEALEARASARRAGGSFDDIRRLDSRDCYVFGYAAPSRRPDGRASAPLPDPRRAVQRPERIYQSPGHVDMYVSVTGLKRDSKPLLIAAAPVPISRNRHDPYFTALRDALDRSVERLEADGFEVLRNPIPFGSDGKASSRRPRLYNNVLLENEARAPAGRPWVWLMHFADEGGFEEFDSENARLWRSLGFEVVPTAGWGVFTGDYGGIRCATKVVKRKGPGRVAAPANEARRATSPLDHIQGDGRSASKTWPS